MMSSHHNLIWQAMVKALHAHIYLILDLGLALYLANSPLLGSDFVTACDVIYVAYTDIYHKCVELHVSEMVSIPFWKERARVQIHIWLRFSFEVIL